MALTAEYLLLGAVVLGGAGLMLNEAKQSTQQLGADFSKKVRLVGEKESKNPISKHHPVQSNSVDDYSSICVNP